MQAPFDRPWHQQIARVLVALDGDLLRNTHCLFGGGTAIALRHGEYRESVDIDFLVSHLPGYRDLRQRLSGPDGIAPLLKNPDRVSQVREVRADQYGIRTALRVDDGATAIKFEIVLEGRITLDSPAAQDQICGVATLSRLDMTTSKLLANADRWADDGAFSRDLIDLAMMEPKPAALRAARDKASTAYGRSIQEALFKAVDQFPRRPGRLERCIQAMKMDLAPAVLWQRIRRIRRLMAAD